MTETTERVRNFYDEQPFNQFGEVATQAKLVEQCNQVAENFPDLHRWLTAKKEIGAFADLGCGCGWLSATLARHYGWRGEGIDLSSSSLASAQALAAQLGSACRFEREDLIRAVPRPKSLVVSMGVLHHTGRWREGLAASARWLVPGPESLLYLGLYHRPGRTAFLERAAAWRSLPMEEGMLAFAKFFRQSDDPNHIRSWFLDQVHHPEETQVTLAEVAEAATPLGLKVVSTSLFGAWEKLDLPLILERESEYAAIGRSRIHANQYFPGFFTVALARHP